MRKFIPLTAFSLPTRHLNGCNLLLDIEPSKIVEFRRSDTASEPGKQIQAN
ncbi:MAG: hypothetical protein ABIZ64_05150 [Casimicrobium sp.]